MALYRSLTALYTDYGYVPANVTFNDNGVDGTANTPQLASPSWPPSPMVDCLNLQAAQNQFNQGVCRLGKIARGCPPPAVYWTQLSPNQNIWGLTGLGSQLGTTFAFNGPRQAP
jgi:hypothetical protein